MNLSLCARFSRGLAVLLFVIAVAVAAQPSLAGTITFTAPSITIDVPSSTHGVITGYFDATISETGGSDSLVGYQVDLLLPSQNNITFTYADLNTTSTTGGTPSTSTEGLFNSATYVYAGNSSDQSQSPQVVPFQDSNEVGNADVPNATGTTLTTSALGLVRIEYSIAANYVGTQSLTFNQDNPNTDGNADYVQLNTDLVDVYSPSAVNGFITVKVTPEPASWVIAVLGAVGLFGIRRLRARKG
jgi:hypothetical protein